MRAAILGLCLLLLGGCSRGSAGSAQFARNIGLSTATDVVTETHHVMSQHGFEIERDLPPPDIYIETRWRDRLPFTDELVRGITAVQVRTITRARPRSESTLGRVYSVDVTVEQQVQLMEKDEWLTIAPSAEAQAYANSIIDDLQRRLDRGVRRF